MIDFDSAQAITEQEAPIDINKLFDVDTERRITVYPSSSNTPSNLGHSCDRFLVYKRLRSADAQKHSVTLQNIFDLGNAIERYVIQKLTDNRFEVAESQRPLKDYQFNLSGKIDAKIRHKAISHRWVIAEIKSFSGLEFKKYNTPEDFLNSKKFFYRNYYTQLQAYLYLASFEKQEFEEYAYLILCNKSTGMLKAIKFYRDDEFIETEILRKCERINRYVNNNEIPDAEYIEGVCDDCPFNHICDANNFQNDGARFIDNADLTEKLIERDILKDHHDRWEELDEEVKETLKEYKQQTGSQFLILDNFEIKVATVNSTKYNIPKEVKAPYGEGYSYEKVSIKKMGN